MRQDCTYEAPWQQRIAKGAWRALTTRGWCLECCRHRYVGSQLLRTCNVRGQQERSPSPREGTCKGKSSRFLGVQPWTPLSTRIPHLQRSVCASYKSYLYTRQYEASKPYLVLAWPLTMDVFDSNPEVKVSNRYCDIDIELSTRPSLQSLQWLGPINLRTRFPHSRSIARYPHLLEAQQHGTASTIRRQVLIASREAGDDCFAFAPTSDLIRVRIFRL